MAVRNRLKSIRHKYEMNQKEFAELLGVAQNQYNRYELQRVQPTLELVLRFSKTLKIPVDEIVYLEILGE